MAYHYSSIKRVSRAQPQMISDEENEADASSACEERHFNELRNSIDKSKEFEQSEDE